MVGHPYKYATSLDRFSSITIRRGKFGWWWFKKILNEKHWEIYFNDTVSKESGSS